MTEIDYPFGEAAEDHRLPTYTRLITEKTREIKRLQDAKRRALAIADERSKENVELRAENERLRAFGRQDHQERAGVSH